MNEMAQYSFDLFFCFRLFNNKFKTKQTLTMAITLLDKPLGDLRREIADLRQISTRRDYDIGKLTKLITISNDSLRETQSYQKTLLQQLQEFEFSLADINEILRANLKQKLELKQQKQQPPLGIKIVRLFLICTNLHILN